MAKKIKDGKRPAGSGDRYEEVKKTAALGSFMLQPGQERHANQGVDTIGSLLAQDTPNKPASGFQIGIGKLMDQGN